MLLQVGEAATYRQQGALKDVRASRLKLFPNMSKLSLLVFEARNGDMHLKAARLDITAINNELLDDLERRND